MSAQMSLLSGASGLPTAQRSRLLKLYVDEFYLLDANTDPDPVEDPASVLHRFTISGSTRSLYTVSLRSSGRLHCTCPDAALNCGRLGCVCKHVCFVLFRVLKHGDVAFFSRSNVLTREEVDELSRRARRLRTEVDRALLFPGPGLGGFGDGGSPDFALGTMDWAAAEEDCPICYAPLGADTTALAFCPTCRNGVHAVCVRKWLSTCPAGRKTCVLCRSDAWSRY
jgi:hypothetical protein